MSLNLSEISGMNGGERRHREIGMNRSRILQLGTRIDATLRSAISVIHLVLDLKLICETLT